VKFKVSIYKTEYSQNEFIVDAGNEEEAEIKAEALASNHDFGSGNVEYEVEYVLPIH